MSSANKSRLEGWTLLLAISKGQVYRTQSGCDMYQSAWDTRFDVRLHKYRVDKRVKAAVAAGMVQAPATFGVYTLTKAGEDELKASASS